jgi:hypothetical protein
MASGFPSADQSAAVTPPGIDDKKHCSFGDAECTGAFFAMVTPVRGAFKRWATKNLPRYSKINAVLFEVPNAFAFVPFEK